VTTADTWQNHQVRCWLFSVVASLPVFCWIMRPPQTAANAMKYAGMPGYLAVIGTLSEQNVVVQYTCTFCFPCCCSVACCRAFCSDLIMWPADATDVQIWLGGTDATTEGTWYVLDLPSVRSGGLTPFG
jgi:hypothetical protein